VGDDRPGATFPAVVDVLESTGSDVFAHITLDHSEVAEAQRAAAALNPDARDVPLPTELVARLGSGSRIREGEPAQLWIDTSKLHLFDASTGERL
jgi:multiple sugar transport system ATP-binding protein